MLYLELESKSLVFREIYRHARRAARRLARQSPLWHVTKTLVNQRSFKLLSAKEKGSTNRYQGFSRYNCTGDSIYRTITIRMNASSNNITFLWCSFFLFASAFHHHILHYCSTYLNTIHSHTVSTVRKLSAMEENNITIKASHEP